MNKNLYIHLSNFIRLGAPSGSLSLSYNLKDVYDSIVEIDGDLYVSGKPNLQLSDLKKYLDDWQDAILKKSPDSRNGSWLLNEDLAKFTKVFEDPSNISVKVNYGSFKILLAHFGKINLGIDIFGLNDVDESWSLFNLNNNTGITRTYHKNDPHRNMVAMIEEYVEKFEMLDWDQYGQDWRIVMEDGRGYPPDSPLRRNHINKYNSDDLTQPGLKFYLACRNKNNGLKWKLTHDE